MNREAKFALRMALDAALMVGGIAGSITGSAYIWAVWGVMAMPGTYLLVFFGVQPTSPVQS